MQNKANLSLSCIVVFSSLIELVLVVFNYYYLCQNAFKEPNCAH